MKVSDYPLPVKVGDSFERHEKGKLKCTIVVKDISYVRGEVFVQTTHYYSNGTSQGGLWPLNRFLKHRAACIRLR